MDAQDPATYRQQTQAAAQNEAQSSFCLARERMWMQKVYGALVCCRADLRSTSNLEGKVDILRF